MERRAPDRIVREPECALLTGLSRSSRFLLERRGGFPRRRRITKNAIGWLESELLEWLRTREAGGNTTAEAGLKGDGAPSQGA
jgi:prophage regulatory protein